jgi:hypothetical protein
MLRRFLLPAVLLFYGFAYGQDHTRPDSAAVIRNKVKSVSIYLNAKKLEHKLYRQYFYDTSGHVEREAIAGEMTISYFYDTQGRLNKSVFRDYNGKYLQSILLEYAPGGNKISRVLQYMHKDTVNPTYAQLLDSKERVCQFEQYSSGTLLQFTKTNYNDKNEPVWTYDSIVGKQVREHRNKQLIRYTLLSQDGERKQTWTFSYNNTQLITGANCNNFEGKPVKYTIKYTAPPYAYVIKAAGAGVDTATAIRLFKTDFGYLLPRVELNDGEAFVEIAETPVVPKHNQIYDSKGNIIRDEINYPPGSENRNRVYEYEYTFY